MWSVIPYITLICCCLSLQSVIMVQLGCFVCCLICYVSLSCMLFDFNVGLYVLSCFAFCYTGIVCCVLLCRLVLYIVNCIVCCMMYIEYNLTWTVTQDVGILIRGTDDDGWNGMMVLLIWIVILIMVILGRMVLMNGLLVVFMYNQLWQKTSLWCVMKKLWPTEHSTN